MCGWGADQSGSRDDYLTDFDLGTHRAYSVIIADENIAQITLLIRMGLSCLLLRTDRSDLE